MSQIASSVAALVPPAALSNRPEERLPLGQSVLLVVTLSLGLWAGIGLLLGWALA